MARHPTRDTPIGTILFVTVDYRPKATWDIYSAKAGARAEVTGRGSKPEYIEVKWLDARANGQAPGNYYCDMFYILEKGTPNMSTKIVVNKDNSVQNGGVLLVKPVTATMALVLGNARNGFSNEDHEAFDNALLDLRSKKFTFKYVSSFRAFLDPKARFHELIHSSVDEAIKFNKDFKLGFTDEQITGLVTLHNLVKAKVEEVFTPPVVPYPFAQPVDIELLYGSMLAEEARQWVSDPTVSASQTLRNRSYDAQYQRALLRVGTNRSGNTAIQKLDATYTLNTRRFTEIATKALNWWKDNPSNASRSLGTEQGYEIYAYPTYLKIGCQGVPRAEVERIAQELGIAFPIPTPKD